MKGSEFKDGVTGDLGWVITGLYCKAVVSGSQPLVYGNTVLADTLENGLRNAGFGGTGGGTVAFR